MLHEDVLKLLFPAEVGGVLAQDQAIEGEHLDDLTDAIDALAAEIFPDTADDTIADWERQYEITPESGAVLADRRLAVLQRKRARGGLTMKYFEDLASAAGYTVSIEELQPNAPDYGWESIWVWRVHVPIGSKTLIEFTAGDSSAGDLLVDWEGEETLENIFDRLKPAHTQVIFVYE